jgi:sec-independent protein translocase protein TatC
LEEPEKSMPILEHIEELRRRLLVALLVFLAATIASFFFTDKLIAFLAQPIGGADKLVSIEVTENIAVFMKVALLSGFIISLPALLYELVAYVLPGLHDNEKRWVLMAIPFASLLFIAGVAFAFFVMMPSALPFLVNFIGIRTTPRLSNYFDFITGMLFWIGVIFETPLVIFILAKLKIITAGQLARYWRYAIVIIAVIAAVITPTPDPVNMGLLMLPLIALYGLSILLALLAR